MTKNYVAKNAIPRQRDGIVRALTRTPTGFLAQNQGAGVPAFFDNSTRLPTSRSTCSLASALRARVGRMAVPRGQGISQLASSSSSALCTAIGIAIAAAMSPPMTSGLESSSLQPAIPAETGLPQPTTGLPQY